MSNDRAWARDMKWLDRAGMFVAALIVAFMILAFTTSIVNSSGRTLLQLHEKDEARRSCASAQLLRLVIERQETLGAPLPNSLAVEVRDLVASACKVLE